MSYAEFLATKQLTVSKVGVEVAASDISPCLFPFQAAIVRWAVRVGRCGIFADTGLGKTLMQLEWARLTGVDTLIIAPLQVAKQTMRELDKFVIDVPITLDREGSHHEGLTITNYEQAHKFHASDFGAVVLDESSILKSLDGKTKAMLIKMFAKTERRLCCTATPAPNDVTEIANHAEFLGVMKRAEMLATFFVHDTSHAASRGWRLKRHAEESFYAWLAKWGMSIRRPSDIGFCDDDYELPELSVRLHHVKTDYRPPGELFLTRLNGIGERAAVRKLTVSDRVDRTAELLRSGEQAIVWCGLNEESALIAKALGEDAIEVCGADSPESKVEAIESFIRGDKKILVTKTKIAGFGMNFQHCSRLVFLGLNDSWESYYQAIRRCWRFGQMRDVVVDVVISDAEDAVFQNIQRKEAEARTMSEELVKRVSDYERKEIDGGDADNAYETDHASGASWNLYLGDSVERLKELPDDSIDLSVFSPPFGSLFTYSPTERDLGNSSTDEEFCAHFRYIILELLRLTKPGRIVCCHCQQLPTTKSHDGFVGVKDFRGDLIRAFIAEDWIYHGEICIDKDPQAQAIRTKAKGLLFVTKSKDSSWLRPAYADYILLFRAPGDNAEPIKTDVTNEEWIQYARPIWYGIRESGTLQVAKGRDAKDEKHICPLQLGTIERCIRLWSNQNDTVLSPFAGIGSEGHEAVRLGRRFVGIELKKSYWSAAVANLRRAEVESRTRDIFEKKEEIER